MATNTKDQWVIEFRSGTFFQNLEAERGGPKETAQKFDSKQEAEEFMSQHEWILFNGGMALLIENKKFDINEELRLVSFKCQMRRDWERYDAAKRLGYLCKSRRILPGQIWFHPKMIRLILIFNISEEGLVVIDNGSECSGIHKSELNEENGWIPITWIDPRVYGGEHEFKKMIEGEYD